jgi:hypothetical protein
MLKKTSSLLAILTVLVNSNVFSMGVMDIWRAAHFGNLARVQEFINEGRTAKKKQAIVNKYSETGSTPLHEAARKGESGVVRILLDNGAKANAQTKKEGNTPLECALLELQGLLYAYDITGAHAALSELEALIRSPKKAIDAKRVPNQTPEQRDPRGAVLAPDEEAMFAAFGLSVQDRWNQARPSEERRAAFDIYERYYNTMQYIIECGGQIKKEFLEKFSTKDCSDACFDLFQKVQSDFKRKQIAGLLALAYNGRAGSKSPLALLPQFVMQGIVTLAT